MKLIRRREVTIQTSETFVLRSSHGQGTASCRQCPAGVAMLTPEAAASLFAVPLRWIYRRVEAGQLHFEEMPSGSLLVCPHSLQQAVQLEAGNSGSTKLKNLEER